MSSELATASWEALGTTALVRVDDPAELAAAEAIVRAELIAIDLAVSRFRADSELQRLNARAGAFVVISALLHEAIAVALHAAARTAGAVDPTLGGAIRLAGYTRDYAQLERPGSEEPITAHPTTRVRRVASWEQVQLSDAPPGVLVPGGITLDLGATAKALAADRAAQAVAGTTGVGVLVSLGGDIAVAGRVPHGGWQVHVTDDHRSGPDAPGQTVSVHSGGLATSSVTTRRWRHRGEVMHHILDPATGAPSAGPWRTASVTATSCVEANVGSTAAIVLGAAAPAWLSEQRLPARLVAADGAVTVLGGWPAPG